MIYYTTPYTVYASDKQISQAFRIDLKELPVQAIITTENREKNILIIYATCIGLRELGIRSEFCLSKNREKIY